MSDTSKQRKWRNMDFRVERSRAPVAKAPDFLNHGGTVNVPVAKHGTPWDEVLRRTRRKRAGRPH